jgi:RNA polymerase sigma-70 factor (ECF subfamily)
MLEEKALLQKLARGEADALDCIYNKYKDDLLTIAVSRLCDVHLAEDCLQDVFVGFAEEAGKFQIQHNLKGYLISSILNRARNQLKKEGKTSSNAIEACDDIQTSDNPVSNLVENETKREVFNVLAKLPDEQHEVIVMHLYGEMKFREIAKQLKLSINTVQSRYRYGLEKLKTFFTIKEEEK